MTGSWLLAGHGIIEHNPLFCLFKPYLSNLATRKNLLKSRQTKHAALPSSEAPIISTKMPIGLVRHASHLLAWNQVSWEFIRFLKTTLRLGCRSSPLCSSQGKTDVPFASFSLSGTSQLSQPFKGEREHYHKDTGWLPHDSWYISPSTLDMCMSSLHNGDSVWSSSATVMFYCPKMCH